MHKPHSDNTATTAASALLSSAAARFAVACISCYFFFTFVIFFKGLSAVVSYLLKARATENDCNWSVARWMCNISDLKSQQLNWFKQWGEHYAQLFMWTCDTMLFMFAI